MNNSVLNNDPKKDVPKASSVLQRTSMVARLKGLFAQAARLIASLRAQASQYIRRQNGTDASTAEAISDEDRVAILKTQCDYVRSCYRVKILERQQAVDNVSQNLDTEIDELLDSYQRLKRAYEELERNER